MLSRSSFLALFLTLAAPHAHSQSFVETFDNGSNVGGWDFLSMNATTSPTGGNPGAQLTVFQTGQPGPRTFAAGSVFTGNFFERRVTSVGIDCTTLAHQFAPHTLPLTLVLGTDNGTPVDTSDDCLVFLVGPDLAPQIGEGYLTYDFTIPIDSTTLPLGWGWGSFGLGGCDNPDGAWFDVLSNVTSFGFNYGDPTAITLFDLWDIGIDNPRVTSSVGERSCFGDGGDQLGCTMCPCGNEVVQGSESGCLNATGVGARIFATGGDSVLAGNLRVELTGANPSTFGVLVSGANLLPKLGTCPPGSGIFSSVLDGLRCTGGSLVRHGSRATDMNGDAGATNSGWGPPDAPAGGIASQGGFTNGQTRHFQVFYREQDLFVCQTGQNTSNALSVTLTP